MRKCSRHLYSIFSSHRTLREPGNCNTCAIKAVSLYNTQACVISAPHRSPWGSDAQPTARSLHSCTINSVSFPLIFSLFSHRSAAPPARNPLPSVPLGPSRLALPPSRLLMITGTVILEVGEGCEGWGRGGLGGNYPQDLPK